MKSQGRRDEDSVTIFTGALLFLLVTAVGAVALLLADRLVQLDSTAQDMGMYAVLGCGVASSIQYVYRHRRS